MINKDHPKFEEYKERWEEITNRHFAACENLPDDQIPYEHKKMALELRSLQEEYDFLWPGGLK